LLLILSFFFSSRRRHTRFSRDWSSDVCSSDLETEEEAKQIIAKLGAGESFEDLAKQSKDPGSAQNGGDLDWNTADTFVKEFGDRSEERRVGKECRHRWSPSQDQENFAAARA